MDVVRIAQIVPIGMDFWASARSPDLFDPAIIPENQGKLLKQQKLKYV